MRTRLPPEPRIRGDVRPTTTDTIRVVRESNRGSYRTDDDVGQDESHGGGRVPALCECHAHEYRSEAVYECAQRLGRQGAPGISRQSNAEDGSLPRSGVRRQLLIPLDVGPRS